ncbi:MAG: hypothetical protein IJ859_06640 [Synergistaceae bacterium]|nr:hypothetical protein [Synergistaceae bacterium]
MEKDLKLLKHAAKLHEILNHREKDEANDESEPLISEDRNQKTVQKFIEELNKIREEDDTGATEYYAKNTDKLVEDIKNNARQSIYATLVLNIGDNPI